MTSILRDLNYYSFWFGAFSEARVFKRLDKKYPLADKKFRWTIINSLSSAFLSKANIRAQLLFTAAG